MDSNAAPAPDPAWQHAFLEQLNEAEGVPAAGTPTLDPEARDRLVDDVPDADLLAAARDADGLAADALRAEVDRRGLDR